MNSLVDPTPHRAGLLWQLCESMSAVEKSLTEMGINYVRQRVEEGGIYVDQLFFHDPDGFMVEICNCDNLPVIPLAGETRDPTRRRNGSGVRARGLIVFRRLFSISNKYKSNHRESPKKAIPIYT